MSGPKDVAFFELSCTRMLVHRLCHSRVFLHARICIMYILFHSFTHGMLAFLVAESLMLAVHATPISSWASAQTVLLGHEVPWTAVSRSELGRYSIPMGKHLMTPIWFAPHTPHPLWVSHPRIEHSQEGAPQKQAPQHTQELRNRKVVLEAILKQGFCNPRHSFSKPARKSNMNVKYVNRTRPTPSNTGTANTDQVVAQRQCKIPIGIFVDSSKRWWIGADMSNISNWDIPEIIRSVSIASA